MAQAHTSSPIFSAPVEKFVLLRQRILQGARLQDVKVIEQSILRHGLLTPLVAQWRQGDLIIVDGRKRLAALRRLSFNGRLPESLERIPYRLFETGGDISSSRFVASEMVYKAAVRQHDQGRTVMDIAQSLCVSQQCVRDLLKLKRLSPVIRQAFYARHIDLDVALAFAAIPSLLRQGMLYAQLGPKANVETVLSVAQAPSKYALVA